jgi:hypothetical protein
LLDLFPGNDTFWNDVDFASMVSLSSVAGFDSYTVNRNSDGTVSILINYTEDIHNIDITVQLDPAKSGKLALSRQSPIPIVPTDNEAAFFYDDSTYAQAKLVNILAQVIAACSLFLFFVGIFARKVVGVELMAVVQISFLSLSQLCLRSTPTSSPSPTSGSSTASTTSTCPPRPTSKTHTRPRQSKVSRFSLVSLRTTTSLSCSFSFPTWLHWCVSFSKGHSTNKTRKNRRS